ncbi:MAG: hypothetical protein K2J77_06885, partial [Oscillospiraceae bacterium]|nr:hypothetical protein [Oscillospiraceae bacterium]
MAVIVTGIKTALDQQPKEERTVQKALVALKLNKSEVKSARLYKSSVDARREIMFVSSVILELESPAKERKLAESNANVRLFERHELRVKLGSE